MKTQWWVDGLPCAQVPADDRGLAYGHGLFETMRLEAGGVVALGKHLQRCYRDAPRIGVNLPIVSELRDWIARAIQESGCAAGVVKLIATAGSAPRGYRFSRSSPARILLGIRVGLPDPVQQPVRVRLCETRISSNPTLAGIKHLNRLEQVLARNEWDDIDVHEGLMLDVHEQVIEATQANVFLMRDGLLLTPDLSHCGICGVMREQVLEAASDAGLPYAIQAIPLGDIARCSEMFLTNAVLGIVPVGCFQQQRFQDYSRAIQLQSLIGPAVNNAGQGPQAEQV